MPTIGDDDDFMSPGMRRGCRYTQLIIVIFLVTTFLLFLLGVI